jgi:hypothetical protein
MARIVADLLVAVRTGDLPDRDLGGALSGQNDQISLFHGYSKGPQLARDVADRARLPLRQAGLHDLEDGSVLVRALE